MGGLLLLALLGVYIWLVTIVSRRVKRFWKKATVVLLALLIPTADAIYGRIKLKRMCEFEGGLRTFKEIQEAEGFYEPLGPSIERIRGLGFSFSEGPSSKGGSGVNRLSLNADGTISLVKDVEGMSKYRLRIVQGDPKDVYLRRGFVMERLVSKELLGQTINITYAGGWIERTLGGLYAGRSDGGLCSSTNSLAESNALIAATLKSAPTLRH